MLPMSPLRTEQTSLPASKLPENFVRQWLCPSCRLNFALIVLYVKHICLALPRQCSRVHHEMNNVAHSKLWSQSTLNAEPALWISLCSLHLKFQMYWHDLHNIFLMNVRCLTKILLYNSWYLCFFFLPLPPAVFPGTHVFY